MAKAGFQFFRDDTDLYQEMKIKRLKKKYGPTGYVVFDYLLHEIYRTTGYYLECGENEIFDVAEYWAMDEVLASEIVFFCCSLGLFDSETYGTKHILTSYSIQQSFLDMSRIAKRKDVKILDELLIIPEELPKVPEEHAETMEVPNIVDIDSKAKDNNKKNNRSKYKNNSSGNPPVLGYKECVDVWLKEIHPDFQFEAIHGKKMKSIISKIKKSITDNGQDVTAENISTAFKVMCKNLPYWYKDKDLTKIDSGYNEIVLQIKNPQNGNSFAKNGARKSGDIFK